MQGRFVLGWVVYFMLSSASAAETGPYAGAVRLGYLGSTGNSESQSINAGAELSYTRARWKHALDLAAIGAQSDVDTTAEAYSLAWKSDYSFSERSYLFGLARWQKDKFSAYDQQISEALGYGFRWLDTDRHVLSLEAGAGARQATLRDGTSSDELIGRGALDYTLTLSSTAKFTQSLQLESGADNNFLQSESALAARLLGGVALIVSYRIQNNSDVAPGLEKTDTFASVSLEYAF